MLPTGVVFIWSSVGDKYELCPRQFEGSQVTPPRPLSKTTVERLKTLSIEVTSNPDSSR